MGDRCRTAIGGAFIPSARHSRKGPGAFCAGAVVIFTKVEPAIRHYLKGSPVGPSSPSPRLNLVIGREFQGTGDKRRRSDACLRALQFRHIRARG